MSYFRKVRLLCAGIAVFAVGCVQDQYGGAFEPMPMGTLSDPIWKTQESNAEASDFVIYENEFIDDTVRLTVEGENHLKQIAARAKNQDFPICVEPSSMATDPDSYYQYPIHGDDTLDLQRREMVVSALQEFGVNEAENRVLVAPATTPGFEQFEAERAYEVGFGRHSGSSGFGGGGGFGGGVGLGFF